MQLQKYKFDDAECPECETQLGEVFVYKIVLEVGRHSDGERGFKDGGSVHGHVLASCEECEAIIWEGNNQIDAVETQWKPGEPCIDCNSSYIHEFHIDGATVKRIDSSMTEHIADYDRRRTICYKCESCGTVLQSRPVSPDELKP